MKIWLGEHSEIIYEFFLVHKDLLPNKGLPGSYSPSQSVSLSLRGLVPLRQPIQTLPPSTSSQYVL